MPSLSTQLPMRISTHVWDFGQQTLFVGKLIILPAFNKATYGNQLMCGLNGWMDGWIENTVDCIFCLRTLCLPKDETRQKLKQSQVIFVSVPVITFFLRAQNFINLYPFFYEQITKAIWVFRYDMRNFLFRLRNTQLLCLWRFLSCDILILISFI